MSADACDLTCAACRGERPPLTADERAALAIRLPDWQVVANHHLEKHWTFPDFAAALRFVQQVGAVAEAHGHHPEITFSWGRACVRLWTFKVDGLTDEDVSVAAEIDRLQP
jgi:4a-hydroxytetrahydrobiopterin dehydratase